MLLAQASENTLNLLKPAVEQALPFANGLTTPETGFGTFLSGILSGVLVVAVLLTLLYLVWGGIEWISSGGDKSKTEKARDRMTQAVIGLIVLAATVAIMSVVQSFLGVRILNFGVTEGGGGGSGNGGGGNTAVCTLGKTANDGGAGHYCSNGGAATVKCNGPDSHLPYIHWDPVSCSAGTTPLF